MKPALPILLLALLPFVMASDCTLSAYDPCEDPDEDADGHDKLQCGGDDCDDDDNRAYPGNVEVCDDHDDDCDPSTFGARDADGDGYVGDECCNGGNCGDDCNDTDAGVHPANPEVCNDVDDDCDGVVDFRSIARYADGDGDGYGAGAALYDCEPGAGYSLLDNDCDDTNPALVPGEMRCAGVNSYQICTLGAWSSEQACPGQARCASQPNGTGICI